MICLAGNGQLASLLNVCAYNQINIVPVTARVQHTVRIRAVHRRSQNRLQVARRGAIADSYTARRHSTLVNTYLHSRLLADAVRHVTAVEVEGAASVEVLFVGSDVLAAVVGGAGDGGGAGR